MGVGRGVSSPWILKLSAKKGYFFNFEEKKTNFTTFSPPWKKFWENPLLDPPWKKSFRRPCLYQQHLLVMFCFQQLLLRLLVLVDHSGVASPKCWRPNLLTLSEQQYFVLNTASQSTK